MEGNPARRRPRPRGRRRRRREGLPFQPAAVDLLACAFAVVVGAYALVPQGVLDGDAGPHAVLLGTQPRCSRGVPARPGLGLTRDDLTRLAWTVLGTAAAVALIGLVRMYVVSVDRWRAWDAPRYFREQLGFDYHGPGGMPGSFAFNTDEGSFAA